MVPGESTRPIPDRVKESLFNILGPDVAGSRFLDLFAGTGSVGIEALSRGAAQAVFVEREPLAIETIRRNLESTGLQTDAVVVAADVFAWLRRPLDPFEYVFVAPPQYRGLWTKTLTALDESGDALAPDAWVMVQIDPEEYQAVSLERLDEFDQRRYGNTLLVFFRMPGADEPLTAPS